MKKLLLILALATFTGATFAQESRAERDQIRAQRQAEFTQKLTAAIHDQNFTFVAESLNPNFGPSLPVTGIQNYVSIYPKYLDINLPYVSFNTAMPSPRQLNFSAFHYTYEYNVMNNRAFIKIFVNNVQNLQDLSIQQNLSYTMHLDISLVSGSSTLTIVPNFNSQVQYLGTIQFN